MTPWQEVTRDLTPDQIELFREYVARTDPSALDLERLRALRVAWAFAKNPDGYPNRTVAIGTAAATKRRILPLGFSIAFLALAVLVLLVSSPVGGGSRGPAEYGIAFLLLALVAVLLFMRD